MDLSTLSAGLDSVLPYLVPLAAAFGASVLTASQQRRADVERRAHEDERERERWERDRLADTYSEALSAVASYGEAASFVIWWTLQSTSRATASEETLRGAAEHLNATNLAVNLARARLLLLDPEGAEVVEEARKAIRLHVESIRPRTGQPQPTAESMRSTNTALERSTAEALSAIQRSATAALGRAAARL